MDNQLFSQPHFNFVASWLRQMTDASSRWLITDSFTPGPNEILLKRTTRSSTKFAEWWIPTPPSFDLNWTIEHVILAKSQVPALDDRVDHIHHHFDFLSLGDSDPPSNSSQPLNSIKPLKIAKKSNIPPSPHTPILADPDYTFTFTPPIPAPQFPKPTTQQTATAQKHRTAKKHDARKKARQQQNSPNPTDYQVRRNTRIRILTEAKPLTIRFDSVRAIAASSGYIGRDGIHFPNRIWRLDEVVGPGSRFDFQLIRWDGTYMIIHHLISLKLTLLSESLFRL
ncbi:hypothetical protein VKT23_015440 [Stygiomarasmius scandens]|uniref:Uncharacterized protein n=1 Tax=Marasmiellus scandens TaxID=2682957 RepID=A0ABR1J0W9_9AGAR